MTLSTKLNSNDRFIRWQEILRGHVTFINNLILTIAVAIVGFCVNLLTENEFNPEGIKKKLFTTGLVLVLFSIPVGILATINRLKDFRTTLQKVKGELTNDDATDLDALKRWMNLYGKTTWILLYGQLLTFFAGTSLLVIAFCILYSDKLF